MSSCWTSLVDQRKRHTPNYSRETGTDTQGLAVTTTPEDVVARNTVFATNRFRDDLTINAWGNITVIGCVDSRVDPPTFSACPTVRRPSSVT